MKAGTFALTKTRAALTSKWAEAISAAHENAVGLRIRAKDAAKVRRTQKALYTFDLRHPEIRVEVYRQILGDAEDGEGRLALEAQIKIHGMLSGEVQRAYNAIARARTRSMSGGPSYRKLVVMYRRACDTLRAFDVRYPAVLSSVSLDPTAWTDS